MRKDILIICRGGGDLATGIIHRLHKAGFRVLVLEASKPSAIRRQVSFCEAIYEGTVTIEGVTAVRIDSYEACGACWENGRVPVLVDSQGASIEILKPDILIDAIIAKQNMGTHKRMAPLTIGVGPGFVAGIDVHYVIESMRGHNLARIIPEGSALPNTGIPGNIAGYTAERVIHAGQDGILKNICQIGDTVQSGQEIARIYSANKEGAYVPVTATISGILRGLIRDGYKVTQGLKIADIDPRMAELENCFTISDKARSIGGSVLELVCGYVRSGI